jgi:hypothetical protein
MLFPVILAPVSCLHQVRAGRTSQQLTFGASVRPLTHPLVPLHTAQGGLWGAAEQLSSRDTTPPRGGLRARLPWSCCCFLHCGSPEVPLRDSSAGTQLGTGGMEGARVAWVDIARHIYLPCDDCDSRSGPEGWRGALHGAWLGPSWQHCSLLAAASGTGWLEVL